MKKCYLTWNREVVTDELIFEDLKKVVRWSIGNFPGPEAFRIQGYTIEKQEEKTTKKEITQMGAFIVEGGKSLSGTLTPQGAKNEALQVICACLLTPEKVTLHNLPDILDVNNLISLLDNMGVEVEDQGNRSFSFKAEEIDLDYLKSDEFKVKGNSLRGSVMILGPLLARFGKGYVPAPGGDKIGRRRLDTHFIGFKKLGAKFTHDPSEHFYTVEASSLEGKFMLLDEASVTGTANILMCAVMAKGTTTIYNAACEPYIQQLCKMLISMGAKIEGVASNLLTVKGVEYLKSCEHKLLPDMIEVGSFIGLAAMTSSELTLKDVSVENLGIIPEQFRRLGITVQQNGDNLFIPRQEHYEIETFMDGSIMTIADAPWPGLTPDLLSVFLVSFHPGQRFCADPPENV